MSKPCAVIGITGGISTGKSTFSRRLQELTGARLFDADWAARQLTDGDEEVQRLLRERFGIEIFSANGDLNRAALRAIVFADSEKKRALEQILHPRIRQQWSTAARKAASPANFSGRYPASRNPGELLCDRVVVVACAQEIQQQRLISRMHVTPSAALAMIASQMPLSDKIFRAHHVVWNNGPVAVLDAQARILARFWH